MDVFGWRGAMGFFFSRWKKNVAVPKRLKTTDLANESLYRLDFASLIVTSKKNDTGTHETWAAHVVTSSLLPTGLPTVLVHQRGRKRSAGEEEAEHGAYVAPQTTLLSLDTIWATRACGGRKGSRALMTTIGQPFGGAAGTGFLRQERWKTGRDGGRMDGQDMRRADPPDWGFAPQGLVPRADTPLCSSSIKNWAPNRGANGECGGLEVSLGLPGSGLQPGPPASGGLALWCCGPITLQN